MPRTATATKLTELLIRKKATERRAIRSAGIWRRLRIHAPSARPPAPLAGTIEPTPSSDQAISELVRHDIRRQNTGRNISTYEQHESPSSTTASASHQGSAWPRCCRTSPRPGASSATRTSTSSSTSTDTSRRPRRRGELLGKRLLGAGPITHRDDATRAVTVAGMGHSHRTVAESRRILTSLVGSYAQPNWLIDREKLRGASRRASVRVELWRVDPQYLEEAQDDATLLAIGDQERAGLDILTDGEMRRESYSNRFATALEGVDIDNPGTALDRSGHPNPVPRVVGPVARRHPVQVRDVQFLKAHTSKQVKVTVPGPFTMSQQAQDDYYGSPDEVGMAYADAVRGEILDLFDAGADIVQVDEPYMQARPEPAREYGLDALKHATDGIARTSAIHICFGYAAIIHDRPSGYSFLPELAATEADQVSIETAQSGLELDVLDVAAGEDDHPRRPRPVDRRRGDARTPWRSASGARSPTTARSG